MGVRSATCSGHGTTWRVVAHEPPQEAAGPIGVGVHRTLSETGGLEFPLELLELGKQLGVRP